MATRWSPLQKKLHSTRIKKYYINFSFLHRLLVVKKGYLLNQKKCGIINKYKIRKQMQKYSRQNTKAKIGQFWASICGVSKYWKIALITLVLVGSVGGLITTNAEESYKSTDSIAIVKTDGADRGEYISLDNCGLYLANFQGNWINAVTDISPCFNNGNFYYKCTKPSAANLLDAWQEQISTNKVFVECNRRIGDDTSFSAVAACASLSERGGSSNLFEWIQKKVGGDGRNITLKGGVETCKPLFAEFCATMWDSANFSSGKSDEFCKNQLGFATKPIVATQSGSFSKVAECVKPSPAELEEIKKTLLEFDQKKDKLCKEKNGVGIYFCQKLDYAVSAEGQECIPANKEAKEVALKVTTPDVTASGGALGGLFSILYKVVITILLICLILIEYVQMIILTIMAYIISALLDLSPSAPILTKIGLPLWQIFANLANFLVVGFMVYVGAATMIGLRKTDQAGKDVVTIAVLAMLLNTTYFFLNFVISTVDGFARLLITVFVGKGGLFGLFSGLFGLFSKVSVLRDGKGAIDVSNPISAAGNFAGTIGTAFSTATTQFGANDNGAALTFTFLGEALVVISFFIILLIFKDTFILVFARVTILLLLLITSPVWVVAYFLKDIFKSSPISAAISKLPSQLFGTIFYNFALVLGIIITVLVTGTAQEGFKNYRLDIGDGAGTIAGGGGADAANFLSPNGASLIIAGVVPVFLGVSILYFINQAFKNLFPLLDDIAKQVGNGAADFAKGIISGDIKGGITKFAKGATTLATGGGQLENVATLAPKLAVKGGVMGLGLAAGIADTATGGRLGLQQRLANAEDRFIKPMVYKPSEAFSNWAGERFGENSDQNLNAKERTKRIRDQKKGIRDDRNRGVVANSMDEYNNSNALTGGRRFLVNGAEAKMNADIAEKRMNAGKKTIEQEGRERYLAGNAGAIQEAARLDALANDRENTVNNNVSTEEERGKRTYLEGEGVRLGELLDQSKNQLNELQGINKGIKDIQEARNENTFVTDPANRANIEERASLQTSAELLKKTTAANRGVVEEAGKQGYYNSADGKTEMDAATTAGLIEETNKSNTDKIKAGLETAYNQDSANSATIQDNASAKLSAETVRRTTAASRGVVEEVGKKAYYDSVDGQREISGAVTSEINNELDKVITDSAKSSQETGVKAAYYTNQGNRGRIRASSDAKLLSDLQNQDANARTDLIKARVEKQFYKTPEAAQAYSNLANSSVLQRREEDRSNTARKTTARAYQQATDAYESDKAQKEKIKQERLSIEAIIRGRGIVGTPRSGSQAEREQGLYNDAIQKFNRESTRLYKQLIDVLNEPNNYSGGIATNSPGDLKPEFATIYSDYYSEFMDYNVDSNKPDNDAYGT
jgi:predicted NAD-dependent protein-ADP-ribosyltransferase YbiA (DUF1768 family)